MYGELECFFQITEEVSVFFSNLVNEYGSPPSNLLLLLFPFSMCEIYGRFVGFLKHVGPGLCLKIYLLMTHAR
jgi:hypothetical protein